MDSVQAKRGKLQTIRKRNLTQKAMGKIINLDEETEPMTQQIQQQQMLDLKQHFEVEYAVFFDYKTTRSDYHSQTATGFCIDRLIPLSKGCKRIGAWLSSSPSTASLFLFSYTSDSPLVLLISLNEKIHVSKEPLKCLSTSCRKNTLFPSCTYLGPRFPVPIKEVAEWSLQATKIQLDSVLQIQKFAMRFLSSMQTQSFIDSLKESSKDVKTIGPPSSNYLSVVPIENELINSDRVHYSAANELNPGHPAINKTPLVQSSDRHGVEGAFFEETSAPDKRSKDGDVPPGLSTFFTNSCTEDCEDATESLKIPKDADLFSHLAQHLAASSFKVMLGQLEKFITDMEGDLAIE